MKYMQLILVLMMTVWLSACSTTGDVQDGADVGVEDHSGQTTTGIGDGDLNGESIYDDGTTTVIAGDGDTYTDDALSDPNSPLSNRVIYFELNSNVVRAEDEVTLDAHAAYLATHPNVTVRLEGHTDERGSREYNLALGERRAQAVRQILMVQGASISQFQATSFGEERPAIDGHSESAWQQNRRVEIFYVGG